VVEGGRPRWSTSEHVGGVPVMMPVVGVTAIGAGGGSIAVGRRGGIPKVGPQSTGAQPGPACYGRGGKDATLTDAFLVCGFLDPERFLGGRMPLRRELADEAVARFAGPLGRRRTRRPRASCASPSRTCTRSSPRSSRAPRGCARTSPPWPSAAPARWVGALVAREVRPSPPCSCRAPGGRSVPSAPSGADVVSDASCAPCTRRRRPPRPGGICGSLRRALRGARDWLARHRPRTAGAPRLPGPPRTCAMSAKSYEIAVRWSRPWLAAGRALPRIHGRLPSGPRGAPSAHADAEAPAEIVNLRVQLRAARPRVPLAEVPSVSGPSRRGPRAASGWMAGGSTRRVRARGAGSRRAPGRARHRRAARTPPC
jgi:N-methylhydantoinase A